jgi:hypothetical protein
MERAFQSLSDKHAFLLGALAMLGMMGTRSWQAAGHCLQEDGQMPGIAWGLAVAMTSRSVGEGLACLRKESDTWECSTVGGVRVSPPPPLLSLSLPGLEAMLITIGDTGDTGRSAQNIPERPEEYGYRWVCGWDGWSPRSHCAGMRVLCPSDMLSRLGFPNWRWFRDSVGPHSGQLDPIRGWTKQCELKAMFRLSLSKVASLRSASSVNSLWELHRVWIYFRCCRL